MKKKLIVIVLGLAVGLSIGRAIVNHRHMADDDDRECMKAMPHCPQMQVNKNQSLRGYVAGLFSLPRFKKVDGGPVPMCPPSQNCHMTGCGYFCCMNHG